MESGSSRAEGTEEYINYLTGQLESAVSRQLSELLQSSMQLKADFLGLAGRVERSSPENFRLMEQDFTEVLPSLELQISVSGRLSHTNDIKEA
ncbi:MAG: Ger(x)C family spore germination C-terminal domain-containing protein [Oscillospiraceae bacterium]